MAKKAKRKIRKSARAGTVTRAAIRKAAKIVQAKRKPKQLKRKYWVSRDRAGNVVDDIYTWVDEPVWMRKSRTWATGDTVYVRNELCADFRALHGWCPKPGECWVIQEVWID